MTKGFVYRLFIGAAATALPVAAGAQAMWTPGAEIVGQPVQVTTNGVTNTLYFDPNGSLRVMTPGSNMVQGTWQAASGQLCFTVGGAQECVPYASPFQAGQPVTITSSCNAVETWLAQSTNPMNAAPASERGR